MILRHFVGVGGGKTTNFKCYGIFDRILVWNVPLWTISFEKEVFYVSKLSYGIVNLKPIVPGHVLVIPKRVVKRFQELSPEEVGDLWQSAQHIGVKLEQYYQAQAMTFCIQDGEAAGQTVPHVHVHVIPRRPGDFKRNDQVYEMLESNSVQKWEIDNEGRRNRTEEEMEEEAKRLRTLWM